MLDFLLENIGTILVALALSLILSLVVVAMVKNKKKGISSCSGGCSCCPFNGKCHSEEKTDN